VNLADTVDRLGTAFRLRDLAAALACFVDDDEITYVGSEDGESAHGRAAVATLLGKLFARVESYDWETHNLMVHRFGVHAFVIADAHGTEYGPSGTEPFPYRVSGLLELVDTDWRWRAVQGSEPTRALSAIDG
jgi:hypothetical protein